MVQPPPFEFRYLPIVHRMFSLEILDRNHPILRDIGESTVQRGQCLFIQRRTVHIGGTTEILQQIVGLLVSKPVDQQMKLFLNRHEPIVTLPTRTLATGC